MEQTIIFRKERSIKASLTDGWRMVALGWKRYLASLWPQLLIQAAAAAFLLEMTMQYVCAHALPAWLLARSGMVPASEAARVLALPSVPIGVCWTLALLLFIFASACLRARVFTVIQAYRLTDSMPVGMPLPAGRGEFVAMRRIILIAFIALLAFNLVCLPVLYAALAWKPWIAWFAVPAGAYLWSSANLAVLRYAVFGQTLPASLAYGLKHGFGTSAILQFITLLPKLFSACVFLAPAALYVCVETAATRSILMADSFGLPPYLPVLFFTVNVVTFAVYKFLASLRTWGLALKAQ